MANQFLFVQARRISSADNKAVIRHESVLSLGGGWEVWVGGERQTA